MTDSLKFGWILVLRSGENHTTDGYVVTPNTAQLLATHLQETGGKVTVALLCGIVNNTNLHR